MRFREPLFDTPPEWDAELDADSVGIEAIREYIRQEFARRIKINAFHPLMLDLYWLPLVIYVTPEPLDSEVYA